MICVIDNLGSYTRSLKRTHVPQKRHTTSHREPDPSTAIKGCKSTEFYRVAAALRDGLNVECAIPPVAFFAAAGSFEALTATTVAASLFASRVVTLVGTLVIAKSVSAFPLLPFFSLVAAGDFSMVVWNSTASGTRKLLPLWWSTAETCDQFYRCRALQSRWVPRR